MKIAIFSDIHGNIFSFEPIYHQLKNERCDLHLFLGDICGYYFHQNEVIELLRTLPNLIALAGNHDLMFLKSLENDRTMKEYSQTYGRSFEYLQQNISPQNLIFLQSMASSFQDSQLGIAAYHGSPWNPVSQYIYPDSSMEQFDELEYPLIFLGHTHYCMDVQRQRVRIVNPGSAGQPRDGGWPAYALYDTGTKQLQRRHVKYNVENQIRDILQREDANSYLVEVLQRMT